MPCNWWNWFGSLFWRHLGKIQRLFLISNVSAVNMVGRRGSSPSPNLSATDVKQKETPLTANVATSDTKSRMSPLHSRYPRHWQGTIRHLFSAFFPCPVAVVFRIVNRLWFLQWICVIIRAALRWCVVPCKMHRLFLFAPIDTVRCLTMYGQLNLPTDVEVPKFTRGLCCCWQRSVL